MRANFCTQTKNFKIEFNPGDYLGGTARNMTAKKEIRFREVPAVRKAVSILRLLSRTSEPMGVNAISKELDLVPSTCLHILRVLVAEGLVAPETRGKRYTLDVGILSLARSLIRGNEMIRFTQPELDRISRQYNVSMIAEKTIDIEHSVVVAVSHSSSAMRLNVEVGSRFPTLVSATGRCYAAFGNVSDDELAEHFPKLRWSIAPSKRDWKSQVREAKKKGYAADVGNYISGHMVVSVPIIEHEVMTYGFAAVGDITPVKAAEQDLVADMKAVINNLDRH
tara:strand:+ start:963 stop:1802 length:840 start_codon:yes stop_codon:yes gene_type:complete